MQLATKKGRPLTSKSLPRFKFLSIVGAYPSLSVWSDIAFFDVIDQHFPDEATARWGNGVYRSLPQHFNLQLIKNEVPKASRRGTGNRF
jgi:hypothetical protein